MTAAATALPASSAPGSSSVARNVINDIQDKMHARRVHLIVVAPASATFSIGQLLQAGHHAAYTLYDRANWEQPFREAFTINGHSVVPPAGSDQTPITIR
ncbi:TPA: SAVED domain-containing protein [Burkholderia vietnamiensis]|uniref:SAVED domain-containing protein n=1 Tax=Burkholderia vietnamiensis TaxID=60552 RepID=UPI001B99DC53|nr:SAVED domain-containing protein [Burkholderia vietnamiensis]MBR8219661.1 SAVED domain-containing protein [Burkholderia vietnamiensis]HDR9317935.1 SAVED domain-containing protein [Burkholderia vietnamiensis]